MENKYINVEKFHKQLDEKLKVFNWVIDGRGIHCIPISLGFKLTPERICELYNTEITYFRDGN